MDRVRAIMVGWIFWSCSRHRNRKTIEDTTLDEWNASFAVNVTGTFLTSKYALPLMRAAAAGGTSSSSILVPMMGLLRTRALPPIAQPRGGSCSNPCHGLYHGPEGIRVNAIARYVDTPMLQSFFTGEGSGGDGKSIDDLQQAVKDVHPMRTYGTLMTLQICQLLASDEARYASG